MFSPMLLGLPSPDGPLEVLLWLLVALVALVIVFNFVLPVVVVLVVGVVGALVWAATFPLEWLSVRNARRRRDKARAQAIKVPRW